MAILWNGPGYPPGTGWILFVRKSGCSVDRALLDFLRSIPEVDARLYYSESAGEYAPLVVVWELGFPAVYTGSSAIGVLGDILRSAQAAPVKPEEPTP